MVSIRMTPPPLCWWKGTGYGLNLRPPCAWPPTCAGPGPGWPCFDTCPRPFVMLSTISSRAIATAGLGGGISVWCRQLDCSGVSCKTTNPPTQSALLPGLVRTRRRNELELQGGSGCCRCCGGIKAWGCRIRRRPSRPAGRPSENGFARDGNGWPGGSTRNAPWNVPVIPYSVRHVNALLTGSRG